MDHYNSRKVAEDYHKAFTKNYGNPELKRKAIQRHSKFTSRVKQRGHILDAGCGTGRFVQYFIKNSFALTGITN